jgi:hypothetical protein
MRGLVNTLPEIREMFVKAAAETWDADRIVLELLNSELTTQLQDAQEDIAQAALYLADEYTQRDAGKILLTSPQTGLALAQIPPEAIVQPPPQERENGAIVSALSVVHPELMAALALHFHQQDLEAAALPILKERVQSTPLQRIMGDARLLVATTQGRKQLGKRLQDELVDPFAGTGVAGEFARLCVHSGDPSLFGPPITVTVQASKPVALYDLHTVNLQFDHYSNLRDTLRDRWLRNLAYHVMRLAVRTSPAQEGDLATGFVLTNPPMGVALLRAGTSVLPLDNATETVVLQEHPWVEVSGLKIETWTKERVWEGHMEAEVTIRLPLTGIYVYSLPEMYDPGQVVEVLGT